MIVIRKYPFFFLLLFFLFKKTKSQTDTNYIKSYYNKIIPRALGANKIQDFILDYYTSDSKKTNYKSDDYSTNNQFFIGMDISYKWLTIGYNYGINKENSTSNSDLRISTSYKPIVIQLAYSNLKNLTYNYTDTLTQEIQTFKPLNNSFKNFGVKFEYVFNYKKFCSSAAFTQGGRQIKSKGSVISTLGYFRDDFDFGNIPEGINQSTINYDH